MKRMVSYPAIFHYENDGYWVEIPDVDGFVTQGDTIEEAFLMVREALGLCLEDLEKYPKASSIASMMKYKTGDEDFITMVMIDMVDYRNSKAQSVKKTLTLPAWINDLALKNNINFSETLKEALIEKLGLQT
jgi:predicted RNase H-like HicB family nuclease